MDMVSQLLSPVGFNQFIEEYFENKFLHISRNDSEFYSKIFTINHLDEYLFTNELKHPDNRVVKYNNGEEDGFPDSSLYTIVNSKVIDPLKFVKSYQNGYTLVFGAVHLHQKELRELTNKLETFFQHSFQTNIYLTPKEEQGFVPHYDTHDVFVLQFEGSKTWKIYENNIFLADKSISFEKGKTAPGKLVEEFTLHAGDLLYIPRGLMHDAYCTDSHSGHITLGMTGKTWAEHISQLLFRYSQNYDLLRKYPRFATQFKDQTSKKDIENLTNLVQELITNFPQNQEVSDYQLARQNSISRQHLFQVVRHQELNSETIWEVPERDKLRIVDNPENSKELDLKFYDIKLTLPQTCRAFLEFIKQQEGSFSLTTYQSLEVTKSNTTLSTQDLLELLQNLYSQGMIIVV